MHFSPFSNGIYDIDLTQKKQLSVEVDRLSPDQKEAAKCDLVFDIAFRSKQMHKKLVDLARLLVFCEEANDEHCLKDTPEFIETVTNRNRNIYARHFLHILALELDVNSKNSGAKRPEENNKTSKIAADLDFWGHVDNSLKLVFAETDRPHWDYIVRAYYWRWVSETPTEETYLNSIKCLIYAWHISTDEDGRTELKPPSMLFELSQIAQSARYFHKAIVIANMSGSNSINGRDIANLADPDPEISHTSSDYIYYYNLAGIFLNMDSSKTFKDPQHENMERTQNLLIRAAKLEVRQQSSKSLKILERLYCINTELVPLFISNGNESAIKIVTKHRSKRSSP